MKMLQDFDSFRLDQLIEKAKDWAHIHGFCLRTAERKNSSDYAQIAPFALLPSFVPRRLFVEAINLQPDMLNLYHQVAFDRQFICTALSNVVKTDEFTKRLLEIYKFVYDTNGKLLNQPTVLTIQRPDYMFNQFPDSDPTKVDSISLQQVEVNQISVGCGGLGAKAYQLHRSILREVGYNEEKVRAHLPDNQSIHTIASGLAEAWQVYGNPNGCCLIVVEDDGNRNIFDQRLVEFEFVSQTDYAARVIRLTLTQVATELYVDEEREFRLIMKNDHKEISVVYFRAGYIPQHYPSELEWKARLMLEKSRAIKCPWVGAQLAGTKKVQQLLSRPEILKRFISCPETLKRVKSSFAGLYGFDDGDYELRNRLGIGGLNHLHEEIDDVMLKLYQNPDRFVLKPQLEGGGNNIYGENILTALDQMNQHEKEAYILMDRIFPMRNRNYLIRANQTTEVFDVVSEFGTFGYLLGDSINGIINSVSSGHLLRTKVAGMNEGGLMVGSAVLDSPYLI